MSSFTGGKVTLDIGEEDESYREEDESYREEDESYRYTEWPRSRRVPAARQYGRGIRGPSGGSMMIPGGGTAQVQFSKRLVSEEDFKKAMDQIRADHNETRRLIADLDKRATDSLKRLRSSMNNMSMMSLLLTFIQQPPKLASVTFNAGQTISPTTSTPVTVADSTQKSSSDIMLPLVLMMTMGGGGDGGLFGSGEGSRGGGGMSEMMMPLVLIMAMGK